MFYLSFMSCLSWRHVHLQIEKILLATQIINHIFLTTLKQSSLPLAVSNIGQKGHFYWKKGTTIFNTPACV